MVEEGSEVLPGDGGPAAPSGDAVAAAAAPSPAGRTDDAGADAAAARRSVTFSKEEDVVEDKRIGAAGSHGGNGASEAESGGGDSAPAAPAAAPPPTSPDVMYPPRRDRPNTEPSPYPEAGGWTAIYGSGSEPVYKKQDPLPPVSATFFFRVCGAEDEQPVYESPSESSSKVSTRRKGEVVRVQDFRGAWVRLACETEAQVEENWEGWMVSEGLDDQLLEEIEDPLETEREYTKNLFRRMWKINDHVVSRIRDRGDRSLQYLNGGRVPPGKKALLPEGTRCLNAFWGLEARFVKLPEGEEYWPQGCLTLPESYIRSGWEQPKEEARSGHWRVFAARPFGAHELVEVCPLVEVDIQTCIASMQLRMNVVETPADEDSAVTGKTGRVRCYVPLGYGMLYQQSIELEDVSINWTPVTNYNCKMIAVAGHMYIYATRKIQADEELILEYKRNFRTDQGESIDFTGFTPYWCRQEPPETFAKALTAPCGPRKVRPVPGCVKFGKSKLHERGVFADASYKKGEIIEMCPCLILDLNGADCMQDHCFYLPEVKVDTGGRTVTKRHARYVLPCGYGGMYNHLATGKGENMQWLYDETTQCFLTVADPQDGRTELSRNEELCFDYGDAYWDAPSRRFQRPDASSGKWVVLQ